MNSRWIRMGMLGLGLAALAACKAKEAAPSAETAALTPKPAETTGVSTAAAAQNADNAPGAENAPGVAAGEQYFPLQSYRVGPYAAGGTGFFGGFIDYMQLVNARDGGVGGVKLTWSECETEYVVERGVECYERLKPGLNGAPSAAFNPLSVGIAYALIDPHRVRALDARYRRG